MSVWHIHGWLSVAALLVAGVGCAVVPARSEVFDPDGDGSEWPADCAGDDPTVYPGADEVCGDGSVNDCGGTTAGAYAACNGERALSSAAMAIMTGSGVDDAAGAAVAAPGDVTGDGVPDVLVGAWSADGDERDEGAVYVVAGPVTGVRPLAGEARLVGIEAYGNAGDGVAGPGDLDGDGVAEVLVGAPRTSAGADTSGSVYFVLGPVTGSASVADADARLDGVQDEGFAGKALAGAGDVNGVGTLSFVVGAPGEESYAGVAYVVAGAVEGVRDLRDVGARLAAAEPARYAGAAVAGAGDLDGDGMADVLVGAPDLNDPLAGPGAVFVVRGPVTADQDLADADALYEGRADGDQLGSAVAGVGDTDGDGRDDALFGAEFADRGGEDAGAAYLVLGGPALSGDLDAVEAILVGAAASAYAGASVAGPGDVDGDGLPDLAVGSTGESGHGPSAGAAAVFLSPVSGVLSLADAPARYLGQEAGGLAGWAVAGAGDLDGDGLGELLVGAYGQTANRGAAYVVPGGGY